MDNQNVTICPSCRAVMNRSWINCLACGVAVNLTILSSEKKALDESSDRLLGMSLSDFQVDGAPIEIVVQWWPDPLWFVPSGVEAEAPMRTGVSRGRIWTAKELLELLAIPGLTGKQTITIARAKMIFEGIVSA